MKIAIIGSGIAGLSAAYYLHQQGFATHLFEANTYVGGHTHTIPMTVGQESFHIDTGFIVFNHRSYPKFTQILADLRVPTQATDMSFSVYDPADNFQYAGNGLNGLFADRSNLYRPRFYRLLLQIHRFHRLTKAYLQEGSPDLSLTEFLESQHLDADFRKYYLYPLVASLWSAPEQAIATMPFAFVAHFFANHALLQMIPDLPWQVIAGGSARYVKAILQAVKPEIHLNTPIRQIRRHATGTELYTDSSLLGSFDHVIVATHSDEALQLLAAPSALEAEILSAFPYQENEVILHQDQSIMPSESRTWASWNARLIPQSERAILTYDMNRLQDIPATTPFYVSLNAAEWIDPARILGHFSYSHPQYHRHSLLAQQRQQSLNAHAGIYFCGAYWGYGFHEDGVNSAWVATEQLLAILRGEHGKTTP